MDAKLSKVEATVAEMEETKSALDQKIETLTANINDTKEKHASLDLELKAKLITMSQLRQSDGEKLDKLRNDLKEMKKHSDFMIEKNQECDESVNVMLKTIERMNAELDKIM